MDNTLKELTNKVNNIRSVPEEPIIPSSLPSLPSIPSISVDKNKLMYSLPFIFTLLLYYSEAGFIMKEDRYRKKVINIELLFGVFAAMMMIVIFSQD